MVSNAPRVITFLRQAFGATELRRFDAPDGTVMHAELRIEGSVVMLAEGSPGWPAFPAWVHLYVQDVDEIYQQALAAGGEAVQAPQERSGDPDRRGGVRDPAGNTWWISTQRTSGGSSADEAAPETKGVTVKALAAVDLGPEIEGMAGRQLRMRMVTIEPGGVFGPVHDHKDRPGTVYILQGTITDHRHGVATDYGPGVGWPEDRNTTHWLENRGTIPAVEISVDIVRQETPGPGIHHGRT
jgi:uncharacterized glyoxalase superfamily protein PhnB